MCEFPYAPKLFIISVKKFSYARVDVYPDLRLFYCAFKLNIIRYVLVMYCGFKDK